LAKNGRTASPSAKGHDSAFPEAGLIMEQRLEPLFDKLKKAKFTGELRLRFEVGQPASAMLIHSLPFSEFERELPTVEPENNDEVKA
jgi:hypothetical protein